MNFTRVALVAAFLLLGSGAAAHDEGWPRPMSKVDATIVNIGPPPEQPPPPFTEQELDQAFDVVVDIFRDINRRGGLAAIGQE